MSSQMFVFVCFATLLIAAAQSINAMAVPPFCQSGMVEDMPPHIQKVCSALNNSEQLATALKSYLNSEAAALLTDQAPLKRSDVDHVFLRFGKRR
ncbi:dromyosuppressin [Bactrocera dorsalis]|uniref:Dromyosuppressin n=1 Tax=Bactrocera dorsalis TaxID=27457 RepID=A0A6I9V5L0_BACDO|nr:dromyosuppressin [Bactrocera dorsalis]